MRWLRAIASWHWEPGLFWIRIPDDGPGVLIKDIARHPLLFSQRNGCSTGRRIGRLWIEILPKIP